MKGSCLLLALSVFMYGLSGCYTEPSISNSSEENILPPKAKLTWEKIELPVSAGVLAADGEEIYAAGEYAIGKKGVVRIDSNMKAGKLLPFNFVGEYTSEDGGLSVKKAPDEEKPPYLCELGKAFIRSGVLQMFARCGHFRQLCIATLGENNSPAKIIHFVYPENYRSPSGILTIAPYSPTGLAKLENRILLSTIISSGGGLSGAALMYTDNADDINLQVHWKDEEEWRVIVNVDFIGEEGWMLLWDGTIKYSSDGGSNWKHLAKLPVNVRKILYGLKFRNSQQGYITGTGTDGLVLMTLDGGKTWEEQETEIKEELTDIVLNDDLIIAKSVFGKFLFVKKKNSEWKQLELPDVDYVNDMLLHDGKLLILDGKELFWVHLDRLIKSVFPK